jgi:hypothetical protein
MRKTMRFSTIALAIAMTGGLLLSLAPNASAQRFHGRVVFVAPGPYWGWGPYYPYGYYPYPPYYMAANYGEIKFDTHEKYADVYIDGGYAGRLKDTKKFALKPGNHEIQVRNDEGQTLFNEQVAVTVGHTTKLHLS